MDKYEMTLKMEQIKKLAAKKAYREAAAIANEINWVKVKDWSMLATVINVWEAVGDYEEARDVAIIAYNRNLGGKRLVYKLTQLLIQLKQYDDADELYDEYDKMAYRDADRYVLFYELRKAEGAADSELISILEEYKSQEADAKYLYELAEFYARYSRKDDCIKICDDVVLLFQDGEYVERALKLKQEQGGTLTNMQKKIKLDAENRKQDIEATKEILFEQQKQMIRMRDDELDEVLDEEEIVDIEDSESAEESLSAFSSGKRKKRGLSSLVEAIMNGERFKSDYDDEDDSDEDDDSEGVELEYEPLDINNSGAVRHNDAPEAVNEDEDTEVRAANDKAANVAMAEDDMSDIESDDVSVEEPVAETVLEKEDIFGEGDDDSLNLEDEESDMEMKMSQIPESIQSMIQSAKKQIDDKYDRFNQEEEEERIRREQLETLDKIQKREDELAKEVSVPKYNGIYDTQNIQNELAKYFSEAIDSEQAETESLRPSPKAEPEHDENTSDKQAVNEAAEYVDDDQIEGQMNLAEWLENVREEKYGKQDTKQYSRVEVARILEDKDEKSAAYDRIIEEKKAAKDASEKEENSLETKLKLSARTMVNAARIDLAIRTGKATLKLEEMVEDMKQKAAAEAAEREAAAAKQAEAEAAEAETVETEVVEAELVETEVVEVDAAVSDVVETDEVEADADETVVAEEAVADGTKVYSVAEGDEVSVTTDADVEISVAEETVTEEAVTEGAVTDEVEVEEVVTDEAVADESETVAVEPKRKSHKLKIVNPVLKGQVVVRNGEKRLTGDLAKLFRKYREMPGMEAQIIEFFESIDEEMKMTTSKTGNLIISGNSSSDKIDLARTIVKALNFLYPANTKKIAKTTGDSINARGVEKAMPKLMGTVLIVEGAGAIQPKRTKELLNCLNRETDRMLVIFEDSDAEINVLINFNPELVETFNHRIVLKQYTVNELVEIARKYANKKQYEIDDDALLELYLKIDNLHNTTENIRLDDIKEIINLAIENMERRNSKKIFAGFMRKAGKNTSNYIMPQDFRD